MPEETTDTERGISRRSFITRGAIATGAVVWATPVVDSFVSKAVAGSAGPCSCASSGDTLQVVTSNNGDTVTFTAMQTSSVPGGGTCAGVCSGRCANTDANAPTSYMWTFSGVTPGNITGTTASVYTNPAAPYTMGNSLTLANGVVDCPPTADLTNLSTLTLTFSSAPAIGSFGVTFTYLVVCDTTTGIHCTNQATAQNGNSTA